VTPFLNDKEATQLQTRLSNRADIRYIQIGKCDCGFILPSDDDDDNTTNTNENTNKKNNNDNNNNDDSNNDDNDAIKSKTRTRFVMTNPDMELNIQETEASYCKLLCIDNIQSANIPQSSSRSKPWPSMLLRIGIDLTNVGHVIHDVDEDCVYMVVVPEVARQCSRLLPKELRGVGITVREIDLMVSTSSTGDDDDDDDENENHDYDSEEYIAPYNGILQDMELGSIDLRSLKYK
jgi:hypothetical protein